VARGLEVSAGLKGFGTEALPERAHAQSKIKDTNKGQSFFPNFRAFRGIPITILSSKNSENRENYLTGDTDNPPLFFLYNLSREGL